MFKYYYVVIILQVFCLYHAFSKKSEQKWFWILIFLPLIGSLLYFYVHFYSRRNIENIKEGVKEKIIDSYNIKKLEQKVNFSGTHANKMELISEHLSVGNHARAKEIIESCFNGIYKSDPQLNMKLLQVNFLMENHEEVLKQGYNLKESKEFNNSDEMVAFAWSLYRMDKQEEANTLFKQMDIKFCNYENRLEYAYFLEEAIGTEEAKVKLEELLEEIYDMDSNEKRLNKSVIKGIKYFHKRL